MVIQTTKSLVLFLVILYAETAEVLGARRRCDDLSSLLNEMQTSKEDNQLLHGEVRSLMNKVEKMEESLEGLSQMVARSLPEDCSQAKARGALSKITMVSPPGLKPREVACDQLTDGGGWTVVVARHPPKASSRLHSRHSPPTPRLNFNASWSEYKKGFGDPSGEFWIGNEVLHSLTRDVPHQLYVLLTDRDGNVASSTWDYFRVASEEENYKLTAKEYREDSTAGNGLRHHDGRDFSTHDSDNDIHGDNHCANLHGGGWWFSQCHESLLTGQALRPGEESFDGIVWMPWRRFHTLKAVVMMMRPKPRPCKLGQVCYKLH